LEALLEVIKKGVFVTIQDMGREKFRHLGIPVSGVMDRLAYQIGNLLLGNKKDVACIEVAAGGTVFKALNQFYIVITGGDLTPTINGIITDMYKVISLQKGDILSFKGTKKGVYAYIAVSNGINSQIHYGSQSTYERASFGTEIKKNTIISGYAMSRKLPKIGLANKFIPNYPNHVKINFVKSSHFENIPEEVIESVTNGHLSVGSSNRMGMYLGTKESTHRLIHSNILSEGTTFGTIQLLPNGQPIVLLADSQTTGGYITLGTVIYSDLWKLVQMKQGNTISLSPVEVDEARILNKKFERFMQYLQIECKNKER
jgi:biotin-dependent carboxylase-like uncharacterized protein